MSTAFERDPILPKKGRVRVLAALALLMLLAFFLRHDGHGFRLPHSPEPDSVKVYTQVRALERGDSQPERDPTFGFYPLVVARCVTWFSTPRVASRDGSLEDDLAQASDVHRRGRTTVALLSTLSVPAVFLLSRAFLGTGWALLAAAFMATSVLNIWFAQQFRPHAAAASFALIALLAALELARRGRTRDYLACGVALALAIGALQNGVALLLPFAAALAVRRAVARDVSIGWALASLAIVAVSVRYFYPFMFAESHGKDAAQLGLEGSDFNLSGHIVMLASFNGKGFPKVLDALIGYEPWLFALALAGLVLAVQRVVTSKNRIDRARLSDLVVILAHALPYLIVIGLYQRTYQRFVLPLVPYLACLAAYAVMRVVEELTVMVRQRSSTSRSTGPSRLIVVVTVLLLVGPQVWAALSLVTLRNRPDTGTLAADWIRAHVAPGKERVFLLPTIDLPLRRSSASLAALPADFSPRMSPWLDAQVAGELSPNPRETFEVHTMPIPPGDARARIADDPQGYVRGLDADLAVIEVFEPEHRAVLAAIRTGLAQTGRLVQRISPDTVDTGSNMPLAYQDDELPEHVPWCWRAMHARATGPVIEIYDLR